jgi:hypothetical protein
MIRNLQNLTGIDLLNYLIPDLKSKRILDMASGMWKFCHTRFIIRI